MTASIVNISRGLFALSSYAVGWKPHILTPYVNDEKALKSRIPENEYEN